MTFAERLRAVGFEPANVIVHRIVLDPADADGAYRSTADLMRTDHALVYQRLQDGPAFGAEALVAGFVADDGGRAGFLALRKLVARKAGLAPGDIVYDPDIAHLLHNFILRAKNPIFYDAFESEGGVMLAGVTLRWPQGLDLRRGDDPALLIETNAS